MGPHFLILNLERLANFSRAMELGARSFCLSAIVCSNSVSFFHFLFYFFLPIYLGS